MSLTISPGFLHRDRFPENAQSSATSTNLSAVAKAALIAFARGDRFALFELVAAKALTCILGAGDRLPDGFTMFHTIRGGNGFAPPLWLRA